jgi:hypothetical protein
MFIEASRIDLPSSQPPRPTVPGVILLKAAYITIKMSGIMH